MAHLDIWQWYELIKFYLIPWVPLRAWLQHAYEETLDAANYLKCAITELDKEGTK